MGRRILALVAAVAMVLVAVTVRDRRDNKHTTSHDAGGSGALKLVCATELEAVCDAIDAAEPGVDVTIEPVATTAARLQSVEPAKAEVDGWLAPGPWGAVVDSARASSAGTLFADASAPLARSPFVLAVWKDKRAQLACAEPVDLGCVGDAVIARGFRLGMAADAEAEGGLADAALAVGHIKNKNFATNDLDETDLSAWIAAVDTNADRVGRNPGGRSFTELLTFGAAAADGYLSTEAEVGPEYIAAAKRSQIDLVHLSPTVTADVQLSPRPGDRGQRLAKVVNTDRVRELLRTNGWRVAGLPGVAGVTPDAPRLPSDDGLPSAGVLAALTRITR
ncbi:MAG: hypothetical protein QOJ00_776 [Actinomycetota bacterium]|jgi:hypothetical protein